MGLRKADTTVHSINRMAERLGVTNTHEAQDIIRAANCKGLGPNDFDEGPLKLFLIKKEYGNNKRVKIYKGNVFIFFKTSTSALTVYPLPEEYREEYNLRLVKKKEKIKYKLY